MIQYATLQDAEKALRFWEGQVDSLHCIGHHGNSVYSFTGQNGQKQILRLTDPVFRTFTEVQAELLFVNALADHGLPVARSLPSADGHLAKQLHDTDDSLIASSFTFLEGIEVKEGMSDWTPDFFKEWGKQLAGIHRVAENYRPEGAATERWQWDQEILWRQADELIPRDDTVSREELSEVLATCHSLEKTPKNYGLIHADHAPQNFMFDPKSGHISTFDFGNCCFHWFVSDLAISLSVLRGKQERERIRENLLQGYYDQRPLSDKDLSQIDLFIRLRVVYAYLSRLYAWRENPTPEQVQALEVFQAKVHQRKGWNR